MRHHPFSNSALPCPVGLCYELRHLAVIAAVGLSGVLPSRAQDPPFECGWQANATGGNWPWDPGTPPSSIVTTHV